MPRNASTLFLLSASAIMVLGWETASAQVANSLASGKGAIQFGLTDNFDATSFKGLSILVKKHSSDRRAYRLGISLGLRSSHTIANGIKLEDDGQAVVLMLEKLFYFRSDTRVAPYFGLGPTVGFTDNRALHEWSAGLTFTFGAEFFLVRSLSIIGEYGSSVGYISRDFRVTTYDDNDEHALPIPPHRSKSFGLSPDAVRLGVSLYW